MTTMKIHSRLIYGSASLIRRLFTASAEATHQGAVTELGSKTRLYRRLSALGATGGSVKATLNEYVMEGNVPLKEELDRCVRELRKFKKYRNSLEVMEWMKIRNINFSRADHAVFLDLVAKTKGITEAENYFSGLSPDAKNKFTYGSLLNCYCKEQMIDKALSHFEKMSELKLIDCSLPFNNLMTLYVGLGQPDKVPVLVSEMKRRGITLCMYTYNIWMSTCALLNDFDGVEQVLDEMERISKDKDLRNWTTYTNLAAIYIKAGNFEKAEPALKLAEEKLKEKPHDREGYHFLMSLYANMSKIDEVERIWYSLKANFHTVTNISYLNVLMPLTKLKAFEKTKKVLEEWESCCASYDLRLPKIVIRAYLKENMVEEAKQVFDRAVQQTNNPFLVASEMFMVSYLKNNQLDMALQHFEAAIPEKEKYDWCPALETIGSFFKYFEEHKDVDGAENFYKKLKEMKQITPVVAYTNMLLKTYVAADKHDSNMRQRLEQDQIEINSEIDDLLRKVCPE